MDHSDLLHYVAPCSLSCYACPGYKDGVIVDLSQKLNNYYDGFLDFNANIPEEYRSWLDDFKKFLDKLDQNAHHPSCPSCREHPESNGGCIGNCFVRECYSKKGVDYCGECPDFPCKGATDFFKTINTVIGNDWLNGNSRIKEVGIEQYFEEIKNKSHYCSYKHEN